MFHLKLLISFLSLSIAGQIDWYAIGRNSQGQLVMRWSQTDLQPYSIKQIIPTSCVLTFSRRHLLNQFLETSQANFAWNLIGQHQMDYEDVN